ncbi:hypothetical protein Taro_009622 [Colocasia esculenta]|uniref:Uncharacterized protein n=1 Tax=Colocasia esculenta TaxID=4460 RepID=A0A843U0Z0_COLES|nr:hypothetical protein [Colocasia esculenta]
MKMRRSGRTHGLSFVPTGGANEETRFKCASQEEEAMAEIFSPRHYRPACPVLVRCEEETCYLGALRRGHQGCRLGVQQFVHQASLDRVRQIVGRGVYIMFVQLPHPNGNPGVLFAALPNSRSPLRNGQVRGTLVCNAAARRFPPLPPPSKGIKVEQVMGG